MYKWQLLLFRPLWYQRPSFQRPSSRHLLQPFVAGQVKDIILPISSLANMATIHLHQVSHIYRHQLSIAALLMHKQS